MTLEVSDVASINFFKKTDGVELANLSGQKESQFLIGPKKLQRGRRISHLHSTAKLAGPWDTLLIWMGFSTSVTKMYSLGTLLNIPSLIN